LNYNELFPVIASAKRHDPLSHCNFPSAQGRDKPRKFGGWNDPLEEPDRVTLLESMSNHHAVSVVVGSTNHFVDDV
jgi:hypothetical protein